MRVGIRLVGQYLRHELPSLYARARVRGCTPDRLTRRLCVSRDRFLAATSWPPIPPDVPLIALADAMMRLVCGSMYTFYFVLLRRVDGTEAVICDPPVLPGKETAAGWYAAFNRLPPEVSGRIKALVCDGHPGLASVALWRSWPLQWCNFHIIAAIQGRRSRFAASRHRELGKHLYRLVCRILAEKDPRSVTALASEIEHIGWETNSRQLRKIIGGFVTHVDRYRTYLTRPDLRLPRTNNACETLIGGVPETCASYAGMEQRRVIYQMARCVYQKQKNDFLQTE